MENEENREARRAGAIEGLRAAFAELESGEGLTRLVGGHGIQSRVFEFAWSEPALEIAFRIPYARGSRIAVSCDDRGTSYAVYDAAGELADSGTDWAPLVKRLESELGDSPEPLSVIWP